jgi:transcriptional regulator with XRE-family HTH domain
MTIGKRHRERIAIGQAIRMIRERKGLSLRQVAMRCDVDYADIARIENGKKDSRISTFIELGVGLELGPEEVSVIIAALWKE